MAVLLTTPVLQFFDDNGDPLAGGKLYSYTAGSAFGTPKATFTNAGGGTPNANPVELDAAGRAAVWISGSYGFVLKTAAGVTIWSADNVTSFASGAIGITVTDGSGFTIQNASDLTKQVQFNLAALTTGTTTTITVPDGSFTMGTKANVDARVTIASVPNKVLYGMILANNSGDATNDIDISAGACVSDDGTTLMTLSAITKRLDAAWAVGTNQGGLDTGAIADTTYHVWAIHRTDTSVTDVLFSTSASSPTMPTNYTKKKRIGSFIRVSSAIQVFKQYDIGGGATRTRLSVPVLDINDGTPGTSAKTGTLASIPTGVQFIADFATNIVTNTGASYALITSLDQADTAASNSVFNASGDTANPSNNHLIHTNTSSQIRYRQDNGNTVTMRFVTHGWIDPR